MKITFSLHTVFENFWLIYILIWENVSLGDRRKVSKFVDRICQHCNRLEKVNLSSAEAGKKGSKCMVAKICRGQLTCNICGKTFPRNFYLRGCFQVDSLMNYLLLMTAQKTF
jgi:hypothetical protein